MCAKEPSVKSLHYPLHIDDHQQMETEILKPITYYTTRREARNSNFFKFIEQWFQIAPDLVQQISTIFEYGLDLYLVYDDLLDSSPLRHSLPSMFTVYGINRTILAVDFSIVVLADMYEKLDEKSDNIEKFLKMLPKIFAGLGLELYRRRHNIVPTEQEDFQTSYLEFCLPLLFGADVLALYSNAKNRDMKKLVIASGLYMHVYDDYRNLYCTDYMKTKGFCDDIREGKCTFPIMHAINAFPEESKMIRKILEERTDDVEKKRQCLAILEKCGSFEYTKKIMDELLEVMSDELDKMDDHPPRLKKRFQAVVIPALGTMSG